MKKFLVVLLSAMMVFAFATTAFAAGQYSDVADLSKETQDAISKLSALEIIGGYPDGTFKPSATITRAEFAKMACVASGMQDSADILVNTASQFSDVKAGEWYTGYINLAVSQGFVKGYPDGTFKPNNTITNAEVITVVLRILGYNDNLPGPWPVDYVAKAGALEITSGVVSVSSANAVRSDVARMIDNALEEDIVVWDKDIDDFISKSGDSLLADSFKGQILEDYTVNSWSVDSFSKGNLRLVVADENDKTTGFTVTDATVVSGGYAIYDINNMIVDIIYKYDKDLDKNVVKYVDVLSTKVKNTKVALASGNKVKIGDKEYSAVKGLTLPTTEKNTYYTAYVDEDNYVYLVTVDADNTTPSYVVDEYISSTDRIDTYDKAVTLKNKDVMIFDQDDKAIKASDLKNKDIIKVYENKGDADYVIFVQNWKEATLDGATSAKLSLDGVEFVGKKATFFDDDDDSTTLDKDYIGTKVKYAVNAANEVIGVEYLETGLGNSIYGVVVSASSDESFTDGTEYWTTLTLFNEEGKTVKYDVESEEIERANRNNNQIVQGESVNLTAGELVKVRLNKDGEIHRIYTEARTNDTNKAEVDTKNERITLDKAYAVENNIVAFDIDMDGTKVDSVVLLDKSDIVAGDVKGNGIQFYLDDNDLAAIAVVDFTSKSNAHFGIVKTIDVSNSDITDGIRFYDDNTIYELSGQTVAAKGFYRYEVSNDKVTFVANEYSANTNKAVELIADMSTYAKADKDLDILEVEKVTNGVYRLKNGTEFTIEDDTDVLEVTYDAKGNLYTVENTDSVGKGDKVAVLTRGTEGTKPGEGREENLDSFEELEALYVIVFETSDNNTINDNNDTTGEYDFTDENAAIKSNDEIKVVDGKITKTGYITIGKTEYYFTTATKVTNLTNGAAIQNHTVAADQLADKAAWAITVDGDVITEIGWK